MDEQSNQPDGQLIMPEMTNQGQPQVESNNIAEPNLAQAAEDSSLFENNFTPQDAREELESGTEVKEVPIIEEKTNTRKLTSPVFWLVGILSILAVGVIAIWLAAK